MVSPALRGKPSPAFHRIFGFSAVPIGDLVSHARMSVSPSIRDRKIAEVTGDEAGVRRAKNQREKCLRDCQGMVDQVLRPIYHPGKPCWTIESIRCIQDQAREQEDAKPTEEKSEEELDEWQLGSQALSVINARETGSS